MIEILVTLIIVASALLGTAGLQIYAIKLNKSGELRTQAVFLGSDLVERMETNKSAAFAGGYVLATTNAATFTTATTNCSTTACDSTTLANYDLNELGKSILSQLPQADWTIEQLSITNPCHYRVTIHWTEHSSDKVGHGELFTYIFDRFIKN